MRTVETVQGCRLTFINRTALYKYNEGFLSYLDNSSFNDTRRMTFSEPPYNSFLPTPKVFILCVAKSWARWTDVELRFMQTLPALNMSRKVNFAIKLSLPVSWWCRRSNVWFRRGCPSFCSPTRAPSSGNIHTSVSWHTCRREHCSTSPWRYLQSK